MQIKQTHDSGYYKLKQKHPHGALTDPLQQTYYKRALGIKGLYMLFLALKIYKSQSITSTYFLHTDSKFIQLLKSFLLLKSASAFDPRMLENSYPFTGNIHKPLTWVHISFLQLYLYAAKGNHLHTVGVIRIVGEEVTFI